MQFKDVQGRKWLHIVVQLYSSTMFNGWTMTSPSHTQIDKPISCAIWGIAWHDMTWYDAYLPKSLAAIHWCLRGGNGLNVSSKKTILNMSAPSTNRAPFVFFQKPSYSDRAGWKMRLVFFTTSWGCIYNFLAKPEKPNHHDSIVMDHCLNPTMGIPPSWETCSRETASSEEKTARYQAIGVHWPDFRCPIVPGQVLKGWRCCPPTGFYSWPWQTSRPSASRENSEV